MNNHFFAKSGFADKILNWYDKNARTLPWRSLPDDSPDAYHVWLSEIMLQQTTVATVGPYFEKFLANWPTVRHLATSPLDDVLTAWAGLGYYARARNLHKCAGEVWHKYGGVFPGDEALLKSLPGIGDYTAAAITAIAFDQPAVVVDGNIERIISRIFRVEDELPKGRGKIRELAASLSPNNRPGDYAQALMDIGSSICSPKKPVCEKCPVATDCAGLKAGNAQGYPKKAPKKVKPTRHATILWIENQAGEVLMRRRDEKGLLGGMMEFPSTPWLEATALEQDEISLLTDLGLKQDHISSIDVGLVKHTFTHFHFKLQPHFIKLQDEHQILSNQFRWIHPVKFDAIALPTLMSKVARSVIVAKDRLL